MGFGILLLGYFTATVMSFNIFGAFFKLVGYVLAFVGIKKLSQYHKSFSVLAVSCLSVIAISACCSLGDMSDFLYTNLLAPSRFISEALADTFSYIRYTLELVFNVLLCTAVAAISKETGAPKLVYISIRNLVIYCIYFVLQVICWMPFEAIRSFLSATALPVWVLILNLLILILNVLMLFSAYTKICDEGDVEMKQKPSRFEFVNKMREEREEKARQRAEKYKKVPPQSVKKELYSEEQQRRAEDAERKKKKNR